MHRLLLYACKTNRIVSSIYKKLYFLSQKLLTLIKKLHQLFGKYDSTCFLLTTGYDTKHPLISAYLKRPLRCLSAKVFLHLRGEALRYDPANVGHSLRRSQEQPLRCSRALALLSALADKSGQNYRQVKNGNRKIL